MTDQNIDRVPVPTPELEADITARLKPLCGDWPEPLFKALVRSIAAISTKYDRGKDPDLIYDPRLTEAMLADMKVLAERSAEIRNELQS